MRIALVADLHGNMTALEALESDLRARGIQRIWCLGDLVGKGPDNHLTFDWAMDRCELVLRGNWDEGVGARLFPRDAFYYRQLGDARMRRLVELPLEKHFSISGRQVRLLHGRPVLKSLLHLNSASEQLLPMFEGRFDVVGYADTHRQGQRLLNGGLLFNVGSVGNALGVPLVQYVIMQGREGKQPAPLDLTMVTLPYDVEKAVQLTLAQPDLPFGEHFIHELRTGQYMHRARPKAM